MIYDDNVILNDKNQVTRSAYGNIILFKNKYETMIYFDHYIKSSINKLSSKSNVNYDK